MYCGPSANNGGGEATPYDIEQGTFGTTIDTSRRIFLSSNDTWRIRCEHNKLVGEKEQQQDTSKAEHIVVQKEGMSPALHALCDLGG